MEHVVNERITRYHSGDFIRKFYWNVSAITEKSNMQSGYIVQHIFRKTVDSKGIFVNQEYNHDYWEAWIVNNNKVILEKNDAHDRWTTVDIFSLETIEYDVKENAKQRRGSSGYTNMEGHVYWAPLGSELKKIIDKTFVADPSKPGHVKYAGELLSAWKIEGYSRFDPVFCHAFSHSWDIEESADIEQLITPIF